jgi:hypothetical protein
VHSSRSTTSVVKQLIGGGATLVYDSLTHDNTPHTTTSLLQNHYYPNHQQQKQRKEHVRIEHTTPSLKTNLTTNNTNNNSLPLTGRQLQSDFSYNNNTKSLHTKNRNNSVS